MGVLGLSLAVNFHVGMSFLTALFCTVFAFHFPVQSTFSYVLVYFIQFRCEIPPATVRHYILAA